MTETTLLMLAEDDTFRSAYVERIVSGLEGQGAPGARRVGTIPKTILQYWDKPEQLPADVGACLASWRELEPLGFVHHQFDDRRARDFISEVYGAEQLHAFDRCYHPAMRCDYFRLCYILEHGGFYVDADETYSGSGCEALFDDYALKLQPLCYNQATGEMVDFQLFSQADVTSSDWIYYVNNNPLVSPAGHPVIRLALERSTRLLLGKGPDLGIQSTTGPGNLTASLVSHALRLDAEGRAHDFLLLANWADISTCRWDLSYRSDARNWRLGVPLVSGR